MKGEKKKKKFRGEIKEVHTAWVEVEADDENEAKDEANNKIAADEVETEYAYTMNQDDWNVKEA